MKFTRLMALLSIILLLCAATVRADSSKIGFVVKGKLMVQNASGGKVRAATAAEKTKWRGISDRINPVSPDGKYRAVGIGIPPNQGYGKGFRIVEVKTGRVVMDKGDVAKSLDESYEGEGEGVNVIFDGWLPDSRHFAAFQHSHSAGWADYTRATVNINSKSRIKFNGWLSTNGKTAIIPDQEGLFNDGMGRTYRPQGEQGHTMGERKWFATAIPSWKNYRLGSVTKRPLILNNNPFVLMGRVFPNYSKDDDAVERSKLIRFSSNGNWALMNCFGFDFPDFVSLTSLSTGKMRKISGTNAKFLS